jgi:hypothetical protein
MDLNIRGTVGTCLLGVALSASLASAAERTAPSDAPATKIALVPEPTESPRYLKDEHQVSSGAVVIDGRSIAYQAEAGILVKQSPNLKVHIERRILRFSHAVFRGRV